MSRNNIGRKARQKTQPIASENGYEVNSVRWTFEVKYRKTKANSNIVRVHKGEYKIRENNNAFFSIFSTSHYEKKKNWMNSLAIEVAAILPSCHNPKICNIL